MLFLAMAGPGKVGGKAPWSDRVSAQYSAMPATECIGAGRLEGWFGTAGNVILSKGWGNIESYCFEGSLFFHMQRSPLLRNVNMRKLDQVTFEVVEINGRCEAVKLLLPSQVEEIENGTFEQEPTDIGKPEPKEIVGQRVKGTVRSQHQLVVFQHWGFAGSDSFAGQIFFHLTENPEMEGVPYERDDIVEFDVVIDESRGNHVRAKNMIFIESSGRRPPGPRKLSDKKQAKRDKWKQNWRDKPPPDWDCKICKYRNFGRNKVCKECKTGTRPPREEWPLDGEEEDEDGPVYNQGPAMGSDAYLWGSGDTTVAKWAGWEEGELPESSSGGNKLMIAGNISGGSAQTLALCMGAFNDLISANASAEDVTDKVRNFITEINQTLGEDRTAKHAFAMQIAKHWIITDKGLEIRYRPGQNAIEIIEAKPAAAPPVQPALTQGPGQPEQGWPQANSWPQKRKAEESWW